MNDFIDLPFGSQVLAPVRCIASGVTIRRRRNLPVPGKILVRIGQRIQATEVVATTQISPGFVWIDLARGLGIKPARVNRYLQVQEGEQIFTGDVLAGPVGLMRRVFHSPQTGNVLKIKDGKALLEIEREPNALKAGSVGVVTGLIDNQGVEIDSTGTLVQGVWGNDRFEMAPIVFHAKSPVQVLSADSLGPHLANSIVVAGHCEHAELLEKLAFLPVKGLVLASLNPRLAPAVMKMDIPIMLVEGFGKHPFSSLAFHMLRSVNQHEGIINGRDLMVETGNLDWTEPVPAFAPLKLDQRVRLSSGPYFGKLGILEGVKAQPDKRLGIKVQAGEIKLENGERLVQPLRNLEIIV
jgi:hypothetical protein